MISRLRVIFPEDWQYILDVYKGFLASTGSQVTNEDLLLTLLEIGVRFGERLSRLYMNGFVEICCGVAIPSITLAKLGITGGKAVDIDPKVLACAEDLRNRLGCELEIQCCDIFENRPKLQRSELLIAEKPASYKKSVLEVEFNIRNWSAIEGHNLTLIPSYLGTDTPASYSERCERYEKKLRQVGFKVENQQVCEHLPFRWIIATR
ncbi:MAG: class I SAM-dependent methyltransferase [Deltaproteobacteria bacterium]|nr:class I SAM-dependent methyltransferase [Deltaproteobacteria bacterium]MBW2341660.1 class I SAM-dependent methyltransferase [Deltaproteobacteria bacterium]